MVNIGVSKGGGGRYYIKGGDGVSNIIYYMRGGRHYIMVGIGVSNIISRGVVYPTLYQGRHYIKGGW